MWQTQYRRRTKNCGAWLEWSRWCVFFRNINNSRNKRQDECSFLWKGKTSTQHLPSVNMSAGIIIDQSFFSFFVQVRKALFRPFIPQNKFLSLSNMSEIAYTFHYPLQIVIELLIVWIFCTYPCYLRLWMYFSGVFGHDKISHRWVPKGSIRLGQPWPEWSWVTMEVSRLIRNRIPYHPI